MIGSTIVLDGATLPYRPVGAMLYHVAQQELGFQMVRAMLHVFMLLGAVEAVGGLRIDLTWKPHSNFEKLDRIEIKDPPYNVWLQDSQFFPINSNNSAGARSTSTWTSASGPASSTALAATSTS